MAHRPTYEELEQRIKLIEKAEKDLQRSESLLNATQRIAKVGGWEWNVEDQTMYWTRELYRLHDFHQDAFTAGSMGHIKQSIACYLPDDRKIIIEAFKNCLENGEAYDLEFLFHTRKRQRKWIRTIAEPIRENGTVIKVIGNVIDITEQKKIEDELIKFKKLEATATLAGGIAHDFNNLLAVIVGNIDLTLYDLGMDHRNAGYLNEALNASGKAQQLTQKFITFSSGGAPVKRKLSIKELITKSVDVVLSGADYPTELSFEEKLWQVEVDAGQMSQVFNNVFVNAKESTEDGGAIQIYAENISSLNNESIVDETLTNSQYVKIVISDQGKGIPDQIMSNIFDPYFSIKERGAQKGMGLGLTVAFSIVKQHGGHLVLKSKENVGTTVFIYLPATV